MKRKQPYWVYAERNFDHTLGGRYIFETKLCPKCWAVNGSGICGNCGSKMEGINVRARPPKKYAPKKKWEQFFQLFYPSILKNKNWWKDRLNKKHKS